MVQEIYLENIRKVILNKKKLEKALEVKIVNKGKLVFVDGEADKEYEALQVMEAINLDFPIEQALELKNEDIILQTVHIKDITKRRSKTSNNFINSWKQASKCLCKNRKTKKTKKIPINKVTLYHP